MQFSQQTAGGACVCALAFPTCVCIHTRVSVCVCVTQKTKLIYHNTLWKLTEVSPAVQVFSNEEPGRANQSPAPTEAAPAAGQSDPRGSAERRAELMRGVSPSEGSP